MTEQREQRPLEFIALGRANSGLVRLNQLISDEHTTGVKHFERIYDHNYDIHLVEQGGKPVLLLMPQLVGYGQNPAIDHSYYDNPELLKGISDVARRYGLEIEFDVEEMEVLASNLKNTQVGKGTLKDGVFTVDRIYYGQNIARRVGSESDLSSVRARLNELLTERADLLGFQGMHYPESKTTDVERRGGSIVCSTEITFLDSEGTYSKSRKKLKSVLGEMLENDNPYPTKINGLVTWYSSSKRPDGKFNTDCRIHIGIQEELHEQLRREAHELTFRADEDGVLQHASVVKYAEAGGTRTQIGNEPNTFEGGLTLDPLNKEVTVSMVYPDLELFAGSTEPDRKRYEQNYLYSVLAIIKKMALISDDVSIFDDYNVTFNIILPVYGEPSRKLPGSREGTIVREVLDEVDIEIR